MDFLGTSWGHVINCWSKPWSKLSTISSTNLLMYGVYGFFFEQNMWFSPNSQASQSLVWARLFPSHVSIFHRCLKHILISHSWWLPLIFLMSGSKVYSFFSHPFHQNPEASFFLVPLPGGLFELIAVHWKVLVDLHPAPRPSIDYLIELRQIGSVDSTHDEN
jgi:hypothetical protein